MPASKENPIATIDSGSFVKMRALFWITGIVCGSILVFATRHYFNTDGLTYIEMGEGLREADWPKLVNLSCSPLYAVMLGIAQIILNTNPLNELAALKCVGFISFILAMGACDLMISLLRKALIRTRITGDALRWFPNVAMIIYSLFLVTGLIWVKLRLMSPDMLVLFFVLMSVNVILWIRLDPGSMLKYTALGACIGFGYLAKTFILPFSAVLFALAGLSCRPMKKCITKALLGVLTAMVVAAPLIAALSLRVGRLSFGEGGTLAYTTAVAGQGVATNTPEALLDKPRVLLYNYAQKCTDGYGFDRGYWTTGLKPSVKLDTQLKAIFRNLRELFSDSVWLWVGFSLWFFYLMRLGALKPGAFQLSRLFPVLVIPGSYGLVLFSFVHVESRYVAPFLFLIFAGTLLWPEYDLRGRKTARHMLWATRFLVALIATMLAHSVVDQTLRGLRSTDEKASYEEVFTEFVAVKEFLETQGIAPGARVADRRLASDLLGEDGPTEHCSPCAGRGGFRRSGSHITKRRIEGDG